MNALLVDLIRSYANFFRSTISPSKSSVNQLFTIFVQKIEGIQVRACRDFDQLRKAVSDLSGRKGTKEGKVEERVDGRVVGTKTILIVAIVDSNLDRHRCVYQANDSRRHSDEVGVPAVRGTSEPLQKWSATFTSWGQPLGE